LPLNRLSERFAFEDTELDISTLADWVGACTATLAPLNDLIRAHILAAERLRGDNTCQLALNIQRQYLQLWSQFCTPVNIGAVFLEVGGIDHQARGRAGIGGEIGEDASKHTQPAAGEWAYCMRGKGSAAAG
jgi:hypothetical protein